MIPVISALLRPASRIRIVPLVLSAADSPELTNQGIYGLNFQSRSQNYLIRSYVWANL